MTALPGIRRSMVVGALAARVSRRGPALVVAVVLLVVLVVVAVAAPLIAPQDPNATDLAAVYDSSSGAHLLGTDQLGRDVLSRVIHGARLSLIGPLLIIVLAGLVGGAVAVFSAWRGGRTDAAITGVLDALLGFPALLLALLAVAVFGSGFTAPVVALAVAYAPYFARLLRPVAQSERSRDYVGALTVGGYGGWRIAVRHIIPNLAPFALTQAAIMFGWAMVDLAALSFLGLGVQPPTADWGNMVASGQDGVLDGAPQTALAAGIAIVATVIALNVVAESFADSVSGQDA